MSLLLGCLIVGCRTPWAEASRIKHYPIGASEYAPERKVINEARPCFSASPECILVLDKPIDTQYFLAVPRFFQILRLGGWGKKLLDSEIAAGSNNNRILTRNFESGYACVVWIFGKVGLAASRVILRWNKPERKTRLGYSSWSFPEYTKFQYDANHITRLNAIKPILWRIADPFDREPSAFAGYHSENLEAENKAGNSQNNGLNNADDNKQLCEADKIPLCVYIFVGLFCIGFQVLGMFWVYDHRYILGAVFILLGVCGYLGMETTVVFNDPLFWRALSADKPYRCQDDDHGNTLQYWAHKDVLIIPKASREGWLKWWGSEPDRPTSEGHHAAASTSSLTGQIWSVMPAAMAGVTRRVQ